MSYPAIRKSGIAPTQADIGRKVVYTGNWNGPLECGVITSLSEQRKCAWVRYGTTQTSACTDFSDLEWDA